MGFLNLASLLGSASADPSGPLATPNVQGLLGPMPSYVQSGLLAGGPQGAQPQPQQQAAPAPQPQADPSQQQIAPPQWGHRGFLGDLLDNAFLGGSIQDTRKEEYQRQMADYNQRLMQQQLAQMTPQQRMAFMANQAKFGEEYAKNFAPVTTAGGATTTFAGGAGQGGSTMTAPLVGIDPQSGKPYSVTPQAATTFPSLGGDISAKDGIFSSGRTGPTGQTYSQFQSVPITNTPGNFTPTVNGAAGAAGMPQNGMPPMAANGAPGSLPTVGAPQPTALASPSRTIAGGPNAVAAAITNRATASGLAPDDAANLVAFGKIESNLNPNAPKNGSSTGLFQFHPTTFANLGGTNINDPSQQIDAAITNYGQNKQALSQTLGRPPAPAELYLAHQQGLPGAQALLTADPNMSAVAALTPVYGGDAKRAQQAVTGNFGSPNSTVGQFLQTWTRKVQSRLPQGAPAQARQGGAQAAPVTLAPGGTQFANPAASGAPGTPNAAAPGWQATGAARMPRTLSPQEAVAAGFPAGAVVQQSPAGELSVVQHPEYDPAAKDAMRKSVLTSEEYKQAQAALSAVQAMAGNAGTMTGPSAYSMLDTFARAINPGAVARPTVIETIEKNLGLPAKLVGSLDSMSGKGNLPPFVRQQIINAVVPFAQAHWDQANALNQSNAALAKQHGFDPADVTVPLAARPKPFSVQTPPPPVGSVVTGKGGIQYSFKGGNVNDKANWTRVGGTK